MSTNFIWRILVAPAAETAAPTAPALGSNIASISGYTAIGSTARGDDANLDEESVDISFFDEDGEIMAPVSLTREDIVPMQNGVDSFGFTCYDATQAVLALASDIDTSGANSSKTLITVHRTVVIEVNGLLFDYFPNVKLGIVNLPAGIAADGASKIEFVGKVCAGATIPGGWRRTNYA
jgi:hypothetical protein